MALNSIPNTGQNLDQTRDGIRQNFDVINRGFTVDHVSFNVLPDEGKHNKVTFPTQAGDPALSANEMALYTKLVSGNPALFLKDQNSGSVVNFTSAVKANTGTLTLPSGIIVKWGRNRTTAGGTQSVMFGTAFPTAIYTIYATISVVSGSSASTEANDRAVRVYAYSTTGFSVVTYVQNVPRDREANDYTWLAIGI